MDSLIGRRLAAAQELAETLGVGLEVRQTLPPRPFDGGDWRIVRARRLPSPDRIEVVLAAFLVPEGGTK